MREVAERWKEVQERVRVAAGRAHRDPALVRVVAVTKQVPVEDIAEACRSGVRIFGENYIQEALPKIQAVESLLDGLKPEWHFVGALQSNKAKKAVGPFSLIHSVDRWSVAQAIDKASIAAGVTQSVLIEVNVAGEASKSGVAPAELLLLAEKISQKTSLNVTGLMSFPPMSGDAEKSRKYFALTQELAEQVRALRLPRVRMEELSMGITSDFEVAIEEGATLVRIGTALFGPRS